ncbi:acyl-CoA thioesterase FadM [Paraburkholderia sp. BL23I1N1]|uniref:acyl-CoA thioesterase n=1 Tax=Paraburkholderia sp. BL23I1N1 TaxID=1938802 RepID=UPI000E73DCC9|nr:acyl-CoA thioesterase [Paraburkholderia sp. BL23I1N1]RKE36360.1 acyl-CoA thioesterase FadM [Paraburkholderia sp. BL23I1N1]
MSALQGFDTGPSEWLVSGRPFVVRRQVRWGECDPAGVVYTVNFSEYAVAVANRFYAYLLGGPVEAAKDDNGFGTPIKALSFVFNRSLRPDEFFDMCVTVTGVRERSFDLSVEATDMSGASVFSAKLSPICIARSERRSIPIPPVFRAKLQEVAAVAAEQAS